MSFNDKPIINFFPNPAVANVGEDDPAMNAIFRCALAIANYRVAYPQGVNEPEIGRILIVEAARKTSFVIAQFLANENQTAESKATLIAAIDTFIAQMNTHVGATRASSKVMKTLE